MKVQNWVIGYSNFGREKKEELVEKSITIRFSENQIFIFIFLLDLKVKEEEKLIKEKKQ